MRFLLPADTDIERALELADVSVSGQLSPPHQLSRTFLDTFDWRLARAGLTLVREHDANGTHLQLLDEHELVVATPVDGEIPGWSADLPAPLRTRLGDRTGGRRLLVMGSIDVTRVETKLSAPDSRVIGAAIQEDISLTKGGPLRVLRLEPAGGRKALKRAAKQLRSHGCRVAPSDLRLAARAAGREAGVDPSTPRFEIDPETPAAPVLIDMVGALVVAMVANEKGVRLRIDSEFLHDLRVAVRTMRSLLRHADGALPHESLSRWLPELSWLQDATGDARELDVIADRLDRECAALPAEAAAELAAVRALVAAERDRAQSALVATLDSPRYRRIRDELPADLASLPLPFETPAASAPIADFARSRIDRAYRRAAKRARRIDDQSPVEDLHRLRLRTKELRYLLAGFGSLLERDDRRPATKAVRSLAQALGDLHDEDVHIQRLRGLAIASSSEPPLAPEALLALGALTQRSATRLAAQRSEIAALVTELASDRTRRRFRRLTTAS